MSQRSIAAAPSTSCAGVGEIRSFVRFVLYGRDPDRLFVFCLVLLRSCVGSKTKNASCIVNTVRAVRSSLVAFSTYRTPIATGNIRFRLSRREPNYKVETLRRKSEPVSSWLFSIRSIDQSSSGPISSLKSSSISCSSNSSTSPSNIALPLSTRKKISCNEREKRRKHNHDHFIIRSGYEYQRCRSARTIDDRHRACCALSITQLHENDFI